MKHFIVLKCDGVCVSAWPRYRVLRILDVGQYNLEITSADLTDDSLYECQATEAALRSRRAKLTVLSEYTLNMIRIAYCHYSVFTVCVMREYVCTYFA